MSDSFSAPHFQTHEAARDWFESLRWPGGPTCPRCGTMEPDHRTERPRVYRCAGCGQTFTVTTNTVMERSKLPLHKWVLGFHLVSAEDGIAVFQLRRALGVNYQTAWHLAGRIRAVMAESETGAADALVKAALNTAPKPTLGRDRQPRRHIGALAAGRGPPPALAGAGAGG